MCAEERALTRILPQISGHLRRTLLQLALRSTRCSLPSRLRYGICPPPKAVLTYFKLRYRYNLCPVRYDHERPVLSSALRVTTESPDLPSSLRNFPRLPAPPGPSGRHNPLRHRLRRSPSTNCPAAQTAPGNREDSRPAGTRVHSPPRAHSNPEAVRGGVGGASRAALAPAHNPWPKGARQFRR